MKETPVRIGFAPTRRDCFTHPEAGEMREKILRKISGLGVEIVDVAGINDEGFLMGNDDVEKARRIFRESEIDGLFLPHCNFGSEGIVARLAAALQKPVLLWGPRDGMPLPGEDRTRDTQCGLFATGKALRRRNLPFTYLVNTDVDDPVFENGFRSFAAVCAVVKAFRNLRILQVDVRPDPFWTVMYNEGELLERFGIQVCPITLQDLKDRMEEMTGQQELLRAEADKLRASVSCGDVGEEGLEKLAELKTALRSLCKSNGCGAVAIHCWGPLQKAVGAAACTVNGLLTEEGIPVACETDVHGAISSVLIQAASREASSTFFADLTIRHPQNDNAELLWHCGNFPPSLTRPGTKCAIKCIRPGFGTFPSQTGCEIRGGDITVCRFDGDHGD